MGLILLLLILLPIFFKGKIFDMIVEEGNKTLTAQVDIDDLSLSLIRNFPDFSLTITGLTVEGKDDFEGVMLADVKEIKAVLDVMSVISGDEIKIKRFGVTGADLHLMITPEGKPNWDIVKPGEETEKQEELQGESEESAPLDISVKNYYLTGINLIYEDREYNDYAEISNLNHEGSGNFDLEEFTLSTRTHIDKLTYIMDGAPYLKDVETELDADLGINLNTDTYTFLDNQLRMNEFKLSFDGWLRLVSLEEYEMDLTFGADDTEFKSLLSLVPNAMTADFDDVKAEGSLNFNGMSKGTFKFLEEGFQLPAFDFTLKVPHASVQYPDLPESLDNIEIDFNAQNPGGSDDNTIVNLKTFYLELAKNPVDVKLLVKTPVSDPDITGGIHAQIDLETLKKAYPMEETENLQGVITADVDFAGRMSALDEERYGDFKMEGKLIVLNFIYPLEGYDDPVELKKMYMNFSPQFVDLSTFDMVMGETDISASGKVDNILRYVFNDEVLTGSFDMQSKFINLNSFMDEPAGEEGTSDSGSENEENTEGEELAAFKVPAGVNFKLNANIERMLYEELEIKNIKGGIHIHDRVVEMSNLDMNLLDGSMAMSGSYATINPKKPTIDFQFDIKRFDLQKTGSAFNTIEAMAPVIKSSTGKFSASMKMAGELMENMDADLNTLAGGGSLKTHGVIIENETMGKLDKALKTQRFSPLTLNDVNVKFTFKDGRVTTEPFVVNAGGIKNTISGYTTFEQEINYLVLSDVPSSILGGNVNQIAGSLLKGLQDKGIDAGSQLPDVIKVEFDITGDLMNPDVKPRFGGSTGSSVKDKVKDAVVDKAKEELDKQKEKARDEAREKADQIIKNAQKRADQINAEAKKQADKIRAESKSAATQIRKEAEKQAANMENEASNPFAKKAAQKAGEKLIKEADQKATQTENEAEKRAKQIEAEAQKQADAVMKEARERADEI